MTVTPGSRHDHYEIVEMIGKGGMGEVYRARDTRLPRDVAIKVSAQQFSERFAREAKVIASLNHPNISTLFDVGPNYLVMELVEGRTLSDCIEEGGLPLEDASRIAQQVADALDYAHEKGVVHRDLKPGNIKIRPDGVVKVLDFGLAKMGGVPVGQSDASPTVTLGDTEAGVILGTAAYMSPEQAKGKTVDKRADIWAFGVVFYEMLAGKRLFAGDSMSETLANVIKEEPKWDRVPPQAHRLLRQCLEKDPQKRLRHIGDVMRLLDDAATAERSGVGTAAPLGSSPQHKWLWLGIAAAIVVIASVVVWAPWQSRNSGPAIRFEIQPTEKITFINGSYPMVSPNGKWVVFPAIGADGVRRMYLRALDSVEVRPLAGTESQNPLQPPVYWSPDSRFIAFSSNPAPFAPGQLKKLDISGGPPTTICETRGAVVGLTWNRDGVIVFGDNGSIGNLMRVSAAGGVATPVTVRDRSRGETFHLYPQFLPDGKRFLYFRAANIAENRGTYVGSIDAKPEEQNLKPVTLGDRQVTYTASLIGGPGRLLILRDTTLFAQPFDPGSLELTGEPVPVADQVGSFAVAWAGLYSVSENGVLAYRVGAGGDQVQLTWFDPQGKVTGTVGDKGAYRNPAVSPDGTRVAVTQFDRSSGNSNIWVLDIARGNNTKVTFNAGGNDFPVWSPDGKSILFASNRAGHMDLYLKSADGSGEERLVLKSEADKRPTSWSKDGRFLLYMSVDPKTREDIWILPDPSGSEGNAKPVPYLRTEFQEGLAAFSPDGRWIAYLSGESGAPEAYVRPFYPDKIAESAAGGRWLISKGVFFQLPRWRSDGKELVYRAPSLQMMAVAVSTEKAFEASPPRPLFSTPLQFAGDVTSDGKRFLFPSPEGTNAPSPFTVVTNWQAVLRK